MEASSSLIELIQAYQFDNDRLRVIYDRVLSSKAKVAFLDSNGVLNISD